MDNNLHTATRLLIKEHTEANEDFKLVYNRLLFGHDVDPRGEAAKQLFSELQAAFQRRQDTAAALDCLSDFWRLEDEIEPL